ncbi:MAG: glycosyltransferase [Polyangiaceae bacterium]|nr:glycosyltransferase [Polyangiaceae bacterium]
MSERLRIAHVLSSLHTGGAERVALLCVDRLIRAGHDLTLVSLEEPPNGSLATEFEAAGARILRVPKRSGGYDKTLSARLLSTFLRERFDVIHTHNPPPLSYAAVPARASGARTVHTKHGPHPDTFARLMLRRAGAAATHAFVAVSQPTADFAIQLREVFPWKLRVILNGTDLERFRADPQQRARMREALGVPSDAFVIGTVGRMAPVKNQALLVRSAAPLLGQGVRLVIVGHGAEAENTRALARDLGVEAFTHFAGETPRVPEHLTAFDVFALSSDSEGLPLSLAEAMGTSLPLVCTAVGGVPRVVDEGETGFLVPARDEAAFRAALARFIDDRELARTMGRRARVVAEERYSLDRMMREYLDVYRA